MRLARPASPWCEWAAAITTSACWDACRIERRLIASASSSISCRTPIDSPSSNRRPYISRFLGGSAAGSMCCTSHATSLSGCAWRIATSDRITVGRHHDRGHDRQRVHARARRNLAERVERRRDAARGTGRHRHDPDPAGVDLEVPRSGGDRGGRARSGVHERRLVEATPGLEQARRCPSRWSGCSRARRCRTRAPACRARTPASRAYGPVVG